MGQITPNISIFIPVPGETNYDSGFASGMFNIDQHDHSGGPTGGVPIPAAGLAAGSVDYTKLATNVADNDTGIGTAGSLGANQLSLLGIIKNIFQASPASGLITMDGILAHVRTITGTANQIAVANGTGVSGNPTLSFAPTMKNATQPGCVTFLTTSALNATGNGAVYTVKSDNIQKNQPGTPYSSVTGQFTAPGDGTYLLIGKVRISDFAGATFAQVRINTTTNLYVGDEFTPSGSTFNSLSISCVAPMLTGQTAELQIQVQGMGGDNATVVGDPNDILTFFDVYQLIF